LAGETLQRRTVLSATVGFGALWSQSALRATVLVSITAAEGKARAQV
jgi:hypothetical protein